MVRVRVRVRGRKTWHIPSLQWQVRTKYCGHLPPSFAVVAIGNLGTDILCSGHCGPTSALCGRLHPNVVIINSGQEIRVRVRVRLG